MIDKEKFISLTQEYLQSIEPLIKLNKKICISNIKFMSYIIMKLQRWHDGVVKVDSLGNITFSEKKNRDKKYEYGNK